MDRTAANALLNQQYRELTVDAKFTSQNITDAYSAAIDMSLRQLGYQESDLATADVIQSNVLKYIALLNYYALKRFSTLLSIKFDVKAGSGAVEAARSQAFKMVATLMEQAAEELTQYGIFVGSSQGFQIGTMTLDFQEPSVLSEF
ncbi:MAG TPA: hypothetical protein VHV10_16430 [Ktedonobacteraceae bacterium]|nr:hypothetical protein [Ktedonobacteraceae bacterium]